MDVSEERSVNSAVEQTVKQFSRLDIAVNNAGIGGEKLTHEQELEEWRRVMSVNLDGVWLCQRAQIRQMLKQEPISPPPRGNRGVIINVASMLGLVASSPAAPGASYTSSKHGVMGLTKSDAAIYASQGIRINAVCPGYIATPLLQDATVSGLEKRFMAPLMFPGVRGDDGRNCESSPKATGRNGRDCRCDHVLS